MTAPQIQAVIFDMDGILIDSEPVWQIAEHRVLQSLGLPINFDDALQTTGLRIDQVVGYWYQRFPWENYDNAAVAKAIVDSVVSHIERHGAPMTGVMEALEHCRASGLRIGLATSSSHALVDAVLGKLQIGDYFDAVESAQDLAYGKPHPEVYLNCAHALGITPTSCLAIEDSFNGLIAARAANMQTLVIPAASQRHQAQWVIAHSQADNLLALPGLLAK
ncbi:hexitol phosphatase HxpB [Shewanella salipaludis]|uniref:Hexitol phosphatase HxpB n=1 Tax=Shewanella salipaludis TaxID=2723052 RepID=A0A972JL70_9GAMM|nr:hexitol phosphatase HxpB [Shewanella salipaludis]NMH66950.1 hexitol phosphatase HxpB [Shewanella salipaludis]